MHLRAAWPPAVYLASNLNCNDTRVRAMAAWLRQRKVALVCAQDVCSGIFAYVY